MSRTTISASSLLAMVLLCTQGTLATAQQQTGVFAPTMLGGTYQVASAAGCCTPYPSTGVVETPQVFQTIVEPSYNVGCCREPGAYSYEGYGYGECGCEPGAWNDMGCRPPVVWACSVGALFLSRDESDHYFWSYDDANEADQYTDYRNADFEWETGFEVRLRRMDACSCDCGGCDTYSYDCGCGPCSSGNGGWEVVYWQLLSDDAYTSTDSMDVTGNLNGILNWDQLDYNGDSADMSVNNASIHRVRRELDVYSLEANRIICCGMADPCCGMGDPCGGMGDPCCSSSPWNINFLVGARVFRLEEELQFAADPNDTMLTYENDEIYYTIDTENTLYGLQAGAWGEYQCTCRSSVALGAKAGVYANHIEAYSHIGGAAGTATINNGPNNGRMFRVDADKDDIAVLGELQVEWLYWLSPCWRAGVGYRIVGVSGVATPTDQIYHDLRGLQDIELVDSSGSVILHGAHLRIERQF